MFALQGSYFIRIIMGKNSMYLTVLWRTWSVSLTWSAFLIYTAMKKVIINYLQIQYLLDKHPSQHGKTEKRLLNNWCVRDKIVKKFIKYLEVKETKAFYLDLLDYTKKYLDIWTQKTYRQKRQWINIKAIYIQVKQIQKTNDIVYSKNRNKSLKIEINAMKIT